MNPQDQSILDSAQQQASSNPGINAALNAGNVASLGSTIQQGQSALNNNDTGVTGVADPGNQPANGSQPHGSLLDRLLPTIGGVGGGILGEVIDPFGGGIAGAALGAALAGGGSAAGKALENEQTGQGIGNGVLGAGVGGALGQGIGMGVGALGGKLLSAAGNKATSLGADMIQGQVAKGYLSDAEATALQSKGITNLKTIPSIANEITGKSGLLPNTVKSVLGSSDQGVDITGLDQVAMNKAAEEGTIDSNSIKQINHALNTAVNNSVPGSVTPIVPKSGDALFAYEPGSLKNALPENTLASTQKLEQLANGAYNKGFDPFTKQVTDARQAGLYNVFKGMADHLQNATFGGDNPIPLDEETKISMLNSPQMANLTKINPTTATSLGNDIMNAQNLQDLRPMQSLFVRASNAVKGTATKEGQAVGMNAMGAAKSVGAPLSLALSHPLAAAGSLALASPVADRAGAGILSAVGPKLGTDLAGNLSAGTGGIVGNVLGNSGNDIAPPTSQGLQSGATASNNGANTTMNNQSSPLYQALQQDLLASKAALLDPTNAGNYSAQIGQLPSLIKAVQAVQAAQAGEQNMAQNLSAAGGPQGLFGGLLTNLGSQFTGGEAKYLPGQEQANAAQVAQALSSVNGVPEQQELNQIKGLTPSNIQDQSAAQASLGNIQSLIQALLGNGQGSGVVAANQ